MCCKCKCKCDFTACGCIGIVISIVFGAVLGLLFGFGVIPFAVLEFIAPIVLGLAVLFLIFLFIAVLVGAVGKPCILTRALCKNGICLLAGIIGVILSILLALLVLNFPIVVLFIATGAFFFALMVIALIALISNIICYLCHHKES